MDHQELKQKLNDLDSQGLDNQRREWLEEYKLFIQLLLTALVAVGDKGELGGPGGQKHDIAYRQDESGLELLGRQYTGSYVPAQNQFETKFWIVGDYKGNRVLNVSGTLTPDYELIIKDNSVFLPAKGWMDTAQRFINRYQYKIKSEEKAQEQHAKNGMVDLMLLNRDLD